MKKTYVLDTNVLIHDPKALFSFADNDVVVPIYVIEEIDTLKRADGERGRNARVVARAIDDLRSKGSLVEGVSLNNGGNLFVEINGDVTQLPFFYQEGRNG